nr:MAG TPA: Rad50 zinc hook motif [Caudoviricetes sp.]
MTLEGPGSSMRERPIDEGHWRDQQGRRGKCQRELYRRHQQLSQRNWCCPACKKRLPSHRYHRMSPQP